MRQALLSVSVLLFAAAGYSAEYNMNLSPSGLKLGSYISGPKVDTGKLANHVLVVEFWGHGCGPCLASIPGMNALFNEFQEKGLIIVGLQCWDGSDELVKQVSKSNNIAYTVVNGGSLTGAEDISGVPHAIVFDAYGKCVYRGHPGNKGFEEAVKKAMADAPPPALSPKDFKKLTSIVDAFKKGALPTDVIKLAEKKTSDSDAQTATEARTIVEKLTAWGKERIEQAQALKATEPYECWKALNAVTVDFKDRDAGKEAGKIITDLKKDKEFMAEAKSGEMLDSIKQLSKSLKPVDSLNGSDWSSSAFQKQNAGVLQQMMTLALTMKKQSPKSPYTAEALAILEKYGIKTK
jgi:thiol-disulfide isomerase/thioredoxin